MDYADRCYHEGMEALKGAFLVEKKLSADIVLAILKKLSPILEACRFDPKYQHLQKACEERFEKFVVGIVKELEASDMAWYNGMTDEIEERYQQLLTSKDHASSMCLLGEMFIASLNVKASLYDNFMEKTDGHLRDFCVSTGIAE